MSPIEFKFTPNTDYFAKVEFLMGGSRAGVYLDDIRFGTNLPVGVINKKSGLLSLPDRFLKVKSFAGSYSFNVGKNVQGKIGIFDLSGSLVRMLPITETAIWNGLNSHGGTVTQGTYIAAFKNSTMKLVQKFQVR
jgi:hypothetical protein